MTNNKELFMKWMQTLFYVQSVALVAGLISELPFMGSWFSWVTRFITIATAVIIFKLIPLNERYRKAALFMGVSVVTAFFVSELGLLVLVGAICAMIGTYQEYMGHSEVMAEVDEKLSRNWRSLFNWTLWGGLGFSFLVSIATVVISVVTVSETDFGMSVTIAALNIYNKVLQLIYLVLVKRMLSVCVNYEPQVELSGIEEEK